MSKKNQHIRKSIGVTVEDADAAQLKEASEDTPIETGEMQFINAIIANRGSNAANNHIPLKISEKTGTSFKRAKQLILPASVLSKNF